MAANPTPPDGEPIRVAGEVANRFESLWRVAGTSASRDPEAPAKPTQTEESYRRGFDDGMRTAQAQHDAELGRMRLEIEAELARMQHRASLDGLEHLAEAVNGKLTEIETGLREALVGILGPLAAHRMTQAAQDSFIDAVERVTALRGMLPVTLRGPAELVAPLSEALSERGLAVECEVTGSLTISMEISETSLQSDLPRWLAELEVLLQ
ncbi:MAG: hypothetical protein JNL45_17010 [Hyphomicrobium sp.]|jgi:hypothetical protein|nr:hypothetical protein [Hyphomicrobium sp.]